MVIRLAIITDDTAVTNTCLYQHYTILEYTKTTKDMDTPTLHITEGEKKFCIWETLNLSTDADHRTNIFFWGGHGQKKKEKRKKKSDT